MNATAPWSARLRTYPTRADWLAARTTSDAIGASDVPAILTSNGVSASPYAEPWTVWARRKRPDLCPPPDETDDMRRGTACEPAILAWWSDTTERTAWHFDNAIVEHPNHPWAIMSPDGVTDDGEPVECKLTRLDVEGLPPSGALSLTDSFGRLDYAFQALWQAAVLDAPRAHIAVAAIDHWLARDLDILIAAGCGLDALAAMLRARAELRTYTVEAPPKVRAWLVSRVGEWRERHLIDGEEPEHGRPCDLPRGTETTADPLPDADADEAALVAEWRAAEAKAAEHRAAGKVLTAAAKGLAERVAKLPRLDKGPGLRVAGVGDVVWKVSSRRTVSVGAVEKHAPDLVDRLVKVSTTRRLVVAGAEEDEG